MTVEMQRSANYHGVIFSVTESPRNPHGKTVREFFKEWKIREDSVNLVNPLILDFHGKITENISVTET